MIITDYQKNKKEIDIAVFVSRNDGFWSRLVRRVTKSNWSHTGYVVRETIEGVVRSVVYEADFKTLIIRKFPASLLFKDLEYKIYPFKYKNRKKIIGALQASWGKKYDVKGAALSPICDTKTKNEVYCSEHVRDIAINEPALAPFFNLYEPVLRNRGIFPDDIDKIMAAYEKATRTNVKKKI